MKTLKYILILAVLTSSATAYGSTKISIGFSFQPARQPVYIYQNVKAGDVIYQKAIAKASQTIPDSALTIEMQDIEVKGVIYVLGETSEY